MTGGGRKMRAQAWFGGTGKNSMMHRSWMKNEGMPSDVFDGRPVIGICNAWSELTRCNAQRDRAARPRRRTDQGPRQQCRPRDHHRVENLTVEYRNDHQEVNLRHQFFASQAVRRQMRDSAVERREFGSINWMDGGGGLHHLRHCQGSRERADAWSCTRVRAGEHLRELRGHGRYGSRPTTAACAPRRASSWMRDGCERPPIWTRRKGRNRFNVSRRVK